MGKKFKQKKDSEWLIHIPVFLSSQIQTQILPLRLIF